MGLIWEHGFSQEDKDRIRDAIGEAERQTSGEIRVYFEQNTRGESVLERASQAFIRLGMDRTRDRNGVLFYIAFDDRQFAVLGDTGIHDRVTQVFWESVREILGGYFAREAFVDGLVAGIAEVGRRLRDHFPWQTDDTNELPDDPVFQNEATP